MSLSYKTKCHKYILYFSPTPLNTIHFISLSYTTEYYFSIFFFSKFNTANYFERESLSFFSFSSRQTHNLTSQISVKIPFLFLWA